MGPGCKHPVGWNAVCKRYSANPCKYQIFAEKSGAVGQWKRDDIDQLSYSSGSNMPCLYRSQNSSACLSAQRPRIHRWKFQSPPSQIPLAKTEPTQRKRQKLLPSPKARANSPALTPEGALNANGRGVAKLVLIAAVAAPAASLLPPISLYAPKQSVFYEQPLDAAPPMEGVQHELHHWQATLGHHGDGLSIRT
ncbi:hypothetical protein UY3_13277 [Chelonia mydas]|uniref:Uncharacterized protein n=1 Tax=Chelonia mydas TaxID=8469 RepID=M7AXY8_CHEMY|nr:hypothetical protein UY3_13277 [Chelonia mydas]